MNILLGVASLFTLLVFGITVGTKMPAGPDRSGLGLMWAILTLPRWISIAIVLVQLSQRGMFEWISTSRTLQATVVLSAHTVMGVIVLIAVGAAAESSANGLLLRAGAWIVGYGVPAVVILYLAALVNPGMLPVRPLQWATGACAGVCLAAAATFLAVSARDSMAHQQAAAEIQSKEDEERYRVRLAQFEALPKDGPLGPFLQYIHNEPGDIRERAKQVIHSRANFEQEFAALLGNEYTQEAMSYLITEMPEPSRSLAAPAAGAVARMAARTASSASQRPASYDDEYGYECRMGVQVAERFPAEASRFVQPLEDLLQAVTAPGDRRYASSGRIDVESWLKKNRKR